MRSTRLPIGDPYLKDKKPPRTSICGQKRCVRMAPRCTRYACVLSTHSTAPRFSAPPQDRARVHRASWADERAHRTLGRAGKYQCNDLGRLDARRAARRARRHRRKRIRFRRCGNRLSQEGFFGSAANAVEGRVVAAAVAATVATAVTATVAAAFSAAFSAAVAAADRVADRAPADRVAGRARDCGADRHRHRRRRRRRRGA